VDIRGSASGTEEIEALRPGHVTEQVHAIVLSGGSAFGLETASGVRRYLEQRGIGFRTGPAVVPIVPCAILFDLGIGKPGVRPTREHFYGLGSRCTATSSIFRAMEPHSDVQHHCISGGNAASRPRLQQGADGRI
jgi:L-aminopeptidase/D-esterase-like protein